MEVLGHLMGTEALKDIMTDSEWKAFCIMLSIRAASREYIASIMPNVDSGTLRNRVADARHKIADHKLKGFEHGIDDQSWFRTLIQNGYVVLLPGRVENVVTDTVPFIREVCLRINAGKLTRINKAQWKFVEALGNNDFMTLADLAPRIREKEEYTQTMLGRASHWLWEQIFNEKSPKTSIRWLIAALVMTGGINLV